MKDTVVGQEVPAVLWLSFPVHHPGAHGEERRRMDGQVADLWGRGELKWAVLWKIHSSKNKKLIENDFFFHVSLLKIKIHVKKNILDYLLGFLFQCNHHKIILFTDLISIHLFFSHFFAQPWPFFPIVIYLPYISHHLYSSTSHFPLCPSDSFSSLSAPAPDSLWFPTCCSPVGVIYSSRHAWSLSPRHTQGVDLEGAKPFGHLLASGDGWP